MAAEIFGEKEMVFQGLTSGWNPTSGDTTTKTYKGSLAKAQAFYDANINQQSIDSVTLSKADGIGTVAITVIQDIAENPPNNEFQNITWEVIPQDIYKNIRAFGGRPEPARDGEPDTEKFNLVGDQGELENARLFFETARQKGQVPAGPVQEKYLELLQRGVDQFVRTAVIIRSRIEVASRSQIRASWKFVDRAQTFAEIGIKGGDAKRLIGALNEMDEFDATKRQFLKRGATLRETGKRRFSIEQEWWFARAWSFTFYGGDFTPDNP